VFGFEDTSITIPIKKGLYNAARPGIEMPFVALGTGGYGTLGDVGGEYWDDKTAEDAATLWLSLGGRSIDNSNDYGTQAGVGRAIKNSGIPRNDIFLKSKVGPRMPLGYNEVLSQVDDLLKELQTDYVDLLLIHWPGSATMTDWECTKNQTTFKYCRQQSWLAMEKVFHDGKALAIGVSNFERNHLQDIIDLNSTLPSLNQFEYHPYWHENGLANFCRAHAISVESYSSMGCPDHMASKDNPTHWTTQVIEQPIIDAIAKRYNKSSAQVVLRWGLQQGHRVVVRTKDAKHMQENLNVFDFALTKFEMEAVGVVPTPSNPKVGPDPSQLL